jgi:hypothetical protein
MNDVTSITLTVDKLADVLMVSPSKITLTEEKLTVKMGGSPLFLKDLSKVAKILKPMWDRDGKNSIISPEFNSRTGVFTITRMQP